MRCQFIFLRIEIIYKKIVIIYYEIVFDVWTFNSLPKQTNTIHVNIRYLVSI